MEVQKLKSQIRRCDAGGDVTDLGRIIYETLRGVINGELELQGKTKRRMIIAAFEETTMKSVKEVRILPTD